MSTEPSPVPFAAAQDGVIAAETGLSRIDGTAGTLHYCGYDIRDLAQHATYEETCHLLWNRRLPTAPELQALRAEMADNRRLPKPVLDLLWTFPREAHPMVALRTAVSALGAFDPDADGETPEENARKGRRLTAQIPTVVAAWARIRADQDPVDPDPAHGHAEGFLAMLNGEAPDPERARLFDSILVLHAEHGLNPSTFAARATASTRTDMHAAVTSAVAALKGPLHGGANQQVMETLLRIGNKAGVRPAVEKALKKKQRVMGFGHPVYRAADPRVAILTGISRRLGELASEMLWHEMALEMQQVMAELRPELNPNVDFFAAPALFALGIRPDLSSAVFATSRVAGWTAHVIEQLQQNRFPKPLAAYTGPELQAWVLLAERAKPKTPRRPRKTSTPPPDAKQSQPG